MTGYDAEHRIVCVDSGTAIYVYDAEGRRARKITGAASCSASTGSTVTDYLYDLSGHAITEMSGTGVWNRGEIYAGGPHLATYDNLLSTPTTYFDHPDWLGTERVESAVNGAACETNDTPSPREPWDEGVGRISSRRFSLRTKNKARSRSLAGTFA